MKNGIKKLRSFIEVLFFLVTLAAFFYNQRILYVSVFLLAPFKTYFNMVDWKETKQKMYLSDIAMTIIVVVYFIAVMVRS